MSLTDAEIQPVIARVRRAMPRNMDVMAICDFADELAMRQTRPKFDKRAYQRAWMRRHRAALKGAKA